MIKHLDLFARECSHRARHTTRLCNSQGHSRIRAILSIRHIKAGLVLSRDLVLLVPQDVQALQLFLSVQPGPMQSCWEMLRCLSC